MPSYISPFFCLLFIIFFCNTENQFLFLKCNQIIFPIKTLISKQINQCCRLHITNVALTIIHAPLDSVMNYHTAKVQQFITYS